MYEDATMATSVQARGASKLSATAAAIKIATTAPTIVSSSDVFERRLRLVARYVVREAARCAHAPAILGFY
jgi:hypothetical protein